MHVDLFQVLEEHQRSNFFVTMLACSRPLGECGHLGVPARGDEGEHLVLLLHAVLAVARHVHHQQRQQPPTTMLCTQVAMTGIPKPGTTRIEPKVYPPHKGRARGLAGGALFFPGSQPGPAVRFGALLFCRI